MNRKLKMSRSIRIGSRLTMLYKVIAGFNGILFLILSIIFLLYTDLISFIISIVLGVILLSLGIYIKSISIENNDSILIKGFISKKSLSSEDIDKVGSIFFLYYLQNKNKSKFFFLGKGIDGVYSGIKAPSEACKEILKKIKNEI